MRMLPHIESMQSEEWRNQNTVNTVQPNLKYLLLKFTNSSRRVNLTSLLYQRVSYSFVIHHSLEFDNMILGLFKASWICLYSYMYCIWSRSVSLTLICLPALTHTVKTQNPLQQSSVCVTSSYTSGINNISDILNSDVFHVKTKH